jgi:outer membrane receptor for ferrienterochelin and colicins
MARKVVLLVLVLASAPALAQAQVAGRIVGRVTTVEGSRPLPGATVILVGSTRGAVTDSAGRYSLPGVAAGSHRAPAFDSVIAIACQPRTSP